MNEKDFKSKFLNFLFENNMYSYLLGSQELISSKFVNVEVLVPNMDNFEDIFSCLLYFIEIEILNAVHCTVADPNSALIKHSNIKYITSDKDLHDLDPEYINYNPFIDDKLVYVNVAKSLSDLENYIDDIQISGSKIKWKIPIYL